MGTGLVPQGNFFGPYVLFAKRAYSIVTMRRALSPECAAVLRMGRWRNTD
jgi:hypothetical protein